MNLIIDGNNIFHACYYMTPAPEMAPHLFLNKVRKYVQMFNPKQVLIAWDGGRAKWRQDLMKGEYKAGRKENEASIVIGMKKCQELTEALGVTNVRLPGYEADDVIFNIMDMSENPSDYTVLSADKDFYQLTQSHGVQVFNPLKDTAMFFDIPNYVAYKALVGDGSDNIKGVPSIGPKRATKMLNEKTLDKYFEGKLEHKQIFDRNLRLIDFRQNPQNQEIKDRLGDLRGKHTPTYSRAEFERLLDEHGMKQIKSKGLEWQAPFILRKEVDGDNLNQCGSEG